MAFVNDKFREEEIREYDIPGYGKEKFYAGTIDREKDIQLHEYANGPLNEPSDLFDFIFDIKGCSIFVCLRRRLEEGHTVSWSMVSLDIPQKADIDRNEVIAKLREAMKTYGYYGYKIVPLGFENMNVNVLF